MPTVAVDLRAHRVILAAIALAPLLNAAPAAAATLTVSTQRDELLAHDGRCSLREAIAAVDSAGRRTDCGAAGRRSNTIVLRSGRFVLSIPPATGDDDATGDLNVTGASSLTIAGTGPRTTVIDAHRLGDRALSIASGATVTLRRLRVTGGHPPDAPAGAAGLPGAPCSSGANGADGADAAAGGGIFNSGALVLDTVAVTGNRAGGGGAGGAAAGPSGSGGCGGGTGGHGGSGGGIYNAGTLTVTESTIRANAAGPGGRGGGGASGSLGPGGPGGSGGPGGQGGGIYNQGALRVAASAIYANRAGAGGTGGPGAVEAGARGADGGGGAGAWGGGLFSAGGRLTISDSTLAGNSAGNGGPGGGPTGPGGNGGYGGAAAVAGGKGSMREDTLADNAVGAGGSAGSAASPDGFTGLGGGLFVAPTSPAGALRLQNTIVASSRGSNCAALIPAAIADGGHNLSYGDRTCPGGNGNPRLGPLQDNGGSTWTMALRPRSAAIDRVPRRGAGCPPADQRGVRRPEGRRCDIGAYEFARPTITIISPLRRATYLRGSRVIARFRCSEGGIASAVATCRGTASPGRAIRTGRTGRERFVVTAVDKNGTRVKKMVRYSVFEYVNPVREVSGLTPRRIDLGVDYAGSGPLLALGDGVVTMATNSDDGPSSCWAISCWPGGGIVVFRLSDGPFAGKYVYVAEHITVTVHAGQKVRAGQQIATLYQGYPWSEFGWAAGPGPEALGMADGHRCTCGDPGGWSTIDGRDFDHLLVMLGAPSGWLQAIPNQSMPRGWPTWTGPS